MNKTTLKDLQYSYELEKGVTAIISFRNTIYNQVDKVFTISIHDDKLEFPDELTTPEIAERYPELIEWCKLDGCNIIGINIKRIDNHLGDAIDSRDIEKLSWLLPFSANSQLKLYMNDMSEFDLLISRKKYLKRYYIPLSEFAAIEAYNDLHIKMYPNDKLSDLDNLNHNKLLFNNKEEFIIKKFDFLYPDQFNKVVTTFMEQELKLQRLENIIHLTAKSLSDKSKDIQVSAIIATIVDNYNYFYSTIDDTIVFNLYNSSKITDEEIDEIMEQLEPLNIKIKDKL